MRRARVDRIGSLHARSVEAAVDFQSTRSLAHFPAPSLLHPIDRGAMRWTLEREGKGVEELVGWFLERQAFRWPAKEAKETCSRRDGDRMVGSNAKIRCEELAV